MNENESIDLETLVCPITLQRVRDPVLAKDGHVYERRAIVKWINAKGTSPLTREPLTILDLQVDERIKFLASQRRSSVASYISNDDSVAVSLVSDNGNNIASSAAATNNRPSCFQRHENACFFLVYFSLQLPVVCLFFIILGLVALEEEHSKEISTPSKRQFTLLWNLTNSSSVYQCIHCTSANHYYETFKFNTSASSHYRILVRSNVPIYTDLYQYSFSSSNPRQNRVLFVNNSTDQMQSDLSIFLRSTHVYMLVVTTRARWMTGTFLIDVWGLHPIHVVPLNNIVSERQKQTNISNGKMAFVLSEDKLKKNH